jgi:hypothetical protein
VGNYDKLQRKGLLADGIFTGWKALCSIFQSMSYQSDDLAVHMVWWLCLHPTDISWLGIEAQPLTVADTSKVHNLMARPYITSHTALRDQVQL